MSRCVYKPTGNVRDGKSELACVRCGHHRHTVTHPAKIARACTAPPNPPGACIHRGEASGTRECATCQGSVKIKLFACALHGVCTLGKRIDMLACCAQCGDYEALQRHPDPDDGRAG